VRQPQAGAIQLVEWTHPRRESSLPSVDFQKPSRRAYSPVRYNKNVRPDHGDCCICREL